MMTNSNNNCVVKAENTQKVQMDQIKNNEIQQNQNIEVEEQQSSSQSLQFIYEDENSSDSFIEERVQEFRHNQEIGDQDEQQDEVTHEQVAAQQVEDQLEDSQLQRDWGKKQEFKQIEEVATEEEREDEEEQSSDQVINCIKEPFEIKNQFNTVNTDRNDYSRQETLGKLSLQQARASLSELGKVLTPQHNLSQQGIKELILKSAKFASGFKQGSAFSKIPLDISDRELQFLKKKKQDKLSQQINNEFPPNDVKQNMNKSPPNKTSPSTQSVHLNSHQNSPLLFDNSPEFLSRMQPMPQSLYYRLNSQESSQDQLLKSSENYVSNFKNSCEKFNQTTNDDAINNPDSYISVDKMNQKGILYQYSYLSKQKQAKKQDYLSESISDIANQTPNPYQGSSFIRKKVVCSLGDNLQVFNDSYTNKSRTLQVGSVFSEGGSAQNSYRQVVKKLRQTKGQIQSAASRASQLDENIQQQLSQEINTNAFDESSHIYAQGQSLSPKFYQPNLKRKEQSEDSTAVSQINIFNCRNSSSGNVIGKKSAYPSQTKAILNQQNSIFHIYSNNNPIQGYSNNISTPTNSRNQHKTKGLASAKTSNYSFSNNPSVLGFQPIKNNSITNKGKKSLLYTRQGKIANQPNKDNSRGSISPKQLQLKYQYQRSRSQINNNSNNNSNNICYQQSSENQKNRKHSLSQDSHTKSTAEDNCKGNKYNVNRSYEFNDFSCMLQQSPTQQDKFWNNSIEFVQISNGNSRGVLSSSLTHNNSYHNNNQNHTKNSNPYTQPNFSNNPFVKITQKFKKTAQIYLGTNQLLGSYTNKQQHSHNQLIEQSNLSHQQLDQMQSTLPQPNRSKSRLVLSANQQPSVAVINKYQKARVKDFDNICMKIADIKEPKSQDLRIADNNCIAYHTLKTLPSALTISQDQPNKVLLSTHFIRDSNQGKESSYQENQTLCLGSSIRTNKKLNQGATQTIRNKMNFIRKNSSTATNHPGFQDHQLLFRLPKSGAHSNMQQYDQRITTGSQFPQNKDKYQQSSSSNTPYLQSTDTIYSQKKTIRTSSELRGRPPRRSGGSFLLKPGNNNDISQIELIQETFPNNYSQVQGQCSSSSAYLQSNGSTEILNLTSSNGDKQFNDAHKQRKNSCRRVLLTQGNSHSLERPDS